MTINLADNSPRISYSVAEGVTQTSFTVPFEFFDNGDLNVYVDGTLKTLTTDYTVSGGSGSTGTVTISVTGASGGSTVVITRDIDIERTTDFPTSGPFQIGALNTELDRLTAIAADLDDRAARALQLTDYDAAANLTLPDVNTRKGKTLAFNATTGAVEAGPSIADTQSVANASADIALLADIQDGTIATNAITNVNTIRTDVTTVSGISGNVTTVANNDSNVTTVATNDANITTVAGSIANVNTVSNDITNVNTTATNIANVNTVAGEIGATGVVTIVAAAITDVSTVSGDIAAVITAANDLNEAVSEIDTVANSIANVDLVGTNIANVNTVAGISADVTTVAADGTDIGTVATDISNVNTVAGISANVITVAGISANVTTVAGISADVTAVAGDATDIGTVATDLTGSNTIGTVAGDISNVNAVAGNSTNINAVAGNATNINAVAADATDIGAVAAGISNINTVATDIANVNTVATNITGVNSFAERYRVGTSDPTTDLDAGDLAFNTTDNGFKFYDGSSWQTVNVSGIGSLAEDTTPQLGGNLDLNSSDITGTGDVNITGTITASSTVSGSNITASGTVSGSNIPSFLPESFVTATANGAISDGDVVFQNTDGTVEKFTAAAVTGESLGSAVTIDEYYALAVAFDSSNNKIVFAYRDGSTSQLKCKIGTISGTSVSFGSAVTITTNTPNTQVVATFDTNANKVVIMWSDSADNNDLKGVVGTVSGTSISFGSITTAATGGTGFKLPKDITFDSLNNKVVCIYTDPNNSSYGTSVIGTVSGTSISFGTAVVFKSGSTFEMTCAFDSSNNKVVVAYRDGSTADGEAVVGTVSGTSISYGSSVTFADYSAGVNIGALRSVFDTSQNKVVLFYDEALNGGFGLVGTVSGTSITFGTQTAYRGAGSDDLKNGQPSYDSTAEAVIIVYRDEDNNDYTTLAVGKVSGTSISFRTPVVVNTGAGATQQVSVYDSSNNKTFIAHSRTSTTDEAYVLTLTTAPATDLDTYIGISNGAYSDTATATIQIVGSVDDAQSGLTIGTSYFVADDGSLTTTNNGRKIGKAVSATELIIDTAMTGSEMNAYLGGLV